jgi:hypothetical protein
MLMMASAAVMLVLGLLLTFAPQEVVGWGGSSAPAVPALIAQAAGALYLGFAILNWMARYNVMGGIYSRPVALGNFAHFFVMGLALLRALPGGHRMPVLWVTAFAYAVFAIWFGLVVFRSPRPKEAH